jgi:hypothetical protein
LMKPTFFRGLNAIQSIKTHGRSGGS